MGTSKAALRFGRATLLARVIGAVSKAARPIVVVAAPRQRLPPLPRHARVLRDPVRGRGPLQGLAVALAALAPQSDRAFVTGTDAPFLHPAFVRRMFALADGHDAAVVEEDGHVHPLAAVYATRLHREAEALLAAGRLRTSLLLEHGATRRVTRAELLADPELRAADPELRSLLNVNTPEDYRAALAITLGA
jgi:molybdenum cofactor guanylyltransferase